VEVATYLALWGSKIIMQVQNSKFRIPGFNVFPVVKLLVSNQFDFNAVGTVRDGRVWRRLAQQILTQKLKDGKYCYFFQHTIRF
jgi:hypothetical protein